MVSIKIHNDVAELLQGLTAEQVGRIVLATCAYSRETEMPEDLTTTERFAVNLLCKAIDRDREICAKRRESGQKGGAPKGNRNAQKREKQPILKNVVATNCITDNYEQKTSKNKQKQAKQANGCFGCFEDEKTQKNAVVIDCGADSCEQKQAKQANGCFGCFEDENEKIKENKKEKKEENEKESNKEKDKEEKKEINKEKKENNILYVPLLKEKEKKQANGCFDGDAKNDNSIINLFGEKEKEKSCAKKEKETWRENFGVYSRECEEAYRAVCADPKWIEERQRFNPNVDIRLSLEKAVTEFWLTEAGWQNKKRSRTTTIDWRKTFMNAIGIKNNRIYKTRQVVQCTAVENYHDNKNYENKTKF